MTKTMTTEEMSKMMNEVDSRGDPRAPAAFPKTEPHLILSSALTIEQARSC
jgi:hypothetical protein